MHVDGPISFAAAQAYGAQQATHSAKVATIPVQHIADTTSVQQIADTTSVQHVADTTSVQQLVAAQVAIKVSFDGAVLLDAAPLQLYTRCADRIEAATRIATGQHLNIQA